MNKQQITEFINSKIIDNDNGQITAEVMRNVLNAINEGTGDGYTYIGTATPSTTPITLAGDEKVFYIATEEGDYSKFGLGNISELSVIKSDNGSWKVEGFRLKFLSLNGGQMQGNIDMNGKRIDNIGIAEVNSLPTANLYEGRMVRFKNKTYTFYNGLWLVLSDDLRGHANDTHEENFVYQPTASDLSVKDGFADIKKLKGNTVVWNQKFINNDISNNGVNITTSEDVLILNGTLNTTYVSITNNINGAAKIPLNHIGYYRIIILKDDSNILQNKYVSLFNRGITNKITQNTAKFLYKNTDDSLEWGFGISRCSAGEVFEDVQIKANVFDLTQMFGEGSEPTIEEFEAMFPNDYYEYNEGELMSFDGKGLKSVGFNQWDEKWEVGGFIDINGSIDNANDRIRSKNFIKVLPNTQYYIRSPYTSSDSHVLVYYFDLNYKFIGNGDWKDRLFTTPSNCHYIKFRTDSTYGTTYNNDICINLSHSGYRNGEYEPYEDYKITFQEGKTISQLTGKLNGEGDSVVIFPDGLRSAGEAFDEIVYDEATGKHKAIKRIGGVDMGALNWSNNNMNQGSSVFIISSDQVDNINMARNKNTTSPSNMLSVDYYPSPTYSFKGLNNAISGPFSNSLFKGALMVKNTSYTDVNSFKASLQGQILYYELAEPEIYELDFPINTSYEAYDFGTEEVLYNDDTEVNIPMKASIEYGFNAVDMIRCNFEEIRSLKDRVTALEQAILQIQTANTSTETHIEP